MGWKVLLLDDNPRSAEGLLAALSEVGCDVVVVTDRRLLASAKLLSRLASARVDAVLLSVAPPKLAGLHVFDRIHRDTRTRGIPVVLIASDAPLLAQHECSAAPAEGYVRRPAEHDALVAELGAALLGVVGAGSRTVPPPPIVPEAGESTPQSGVAAQITATERDPPTEGLDALSLATDGIPVEAVDHEPPKRPRVTHEDPESTAPFTIATMTARDAETNAARIKELAAALTQAQAALEAAITQRDVDRALHGDAIAVAMAEAEEALADERAMGESALTSMAAELHAQSARFGKRVTDANARAHAAEERLKSERDGAASTLVTVEASLVAMQRELVETREALAQERALSEAEQARAATKLAAAAAAFDRKQRELVEIRDTTAKRLTVLEREFHLAHGAREQALRELQDERAGHESLTAAKVREAEERLDAERTTHDGALESTRAASRALLAAAEDRLQEEVARGAAALEAERTKHERVLESALAAARSAHDAATASADVASNALLAAAERRLLDEIAGGAFALETAADNAAAARQELLDTETAATKQTGELEEELRRSWTEYDEIAAQREQLRYALEVVQSDLHAAVEERDALRAAGEAARPEQARGTPTLASAEAVRPPSDGADAERRLAAVERQLAEAHHEKDELQARLDREVSMRRADQEVAVGALRGAEERMAALEARAAPLSRPGVSASGELRAARRSLVPESDGARSVPPLSGVIRERRSSMPPPMKSGPRAAARVPVSLEGDRDDTRPAGRSVLLIDGDKTARVNTARALARASCEVTVRDSCVDMAAALRTFDVIVTEVVGVAIDELLTACRERTPTCAILAWTPGLDAARALFEAGGVSGVTVLQKAYRADELVTAVRARLDQPARAASG